MRPNRKPLVHPALALGILALATVCVRGAPAAAGFRCYQVRTSASFTLQFGALPPDARIAFLGADGHWHDADSTRTGDVGSIRVDAGQIDNGSTIILVNPPKDLDLEDRTPPAAQGVSVDGKTVAVKPDIDLGTMGVGPHEVQVTFAEERNQLVGESVGASVDGRAVDRPALTVQAEARKATVSVRVPDLAFGAHTVEVHAADSSPFANSATVRVCFTLVDTANVGQAKAGARVKVDSCFSGYTPEPLIDGDGESCAGSGAPGTTWASAETDSEHWIEIALPRRETIDSVALYWAHSKPSRKVAIQVQKAGQWATVATAEPKAASESCTLVRFAPTETEVLRVLQPAGAGRSDRPGLLWLGEIAVRKHQ